MSRPELGARVRDRLAALALLAVLSAGLGGCAAAVKPVEAPTVPAHPERFTHDATDMAGVAQAALDGPWWKRFNDPLLDSLVEEAVRSNLDLKVAAARVRELAAVARQAGAPLLPSLDANASGARNYRRDPPPGASRIAEAWEASLTLVYEVDLWKRIDERAKAAAFDVEAARLDAWRAYQAIIAATVQSYLNARFALEQAELTRRTVEIDRNRFEIVKNRFNQGLASALEMYLTEQAVAESESRVFSFELLADTSVHNLNVLMGRYAGTPIALEEGARLPVNPATVPAGLPADLLARRSDVGAAMNRLMASHARVNVSRAELLPRLTLTTSAGFASEELGELLTPDSLFWNLIAGLTAPLFNNGRLRAQVELSQAVRDRAVLEYGSLLLGAFREVEDALSAEKSQRERLLALEKSVELARLSLESADRRYFGGLDNLLTSLNSRRALYQAELEYIETRRAILASRVSLHLALGGDWSDASTAAPGTSPAQMENQ